MKKAAASNKALAISAVFLTDRADATFMKAFESTSWASEWVVVCYQPEVFASLQKKLTGAGVSVFHRPGPITDFAAERSWAVKQTSQPWIFFVDSDEVVEPFKLDELADQLHDPQKLVMTVRRQDIFHGRALNWGEVRNVELPRLFRRGAASYQRRVHEILVSRHPHHQSGLVLTHYSHESISEFLQSITYYTQLEAQLRVDEGQTFSWLEMLTYPLAKLGLNLVIRLGFLDGWRGITYAVMMSLHSLFVRICMYEYSKAAN